MDWDHPDPEAHLTTLDAQGQGRVLYITGSVSPIIEGLRITGGNAADSNNQIDSGGGVYILTAQATIQSNFIYSNTAEEGGGLYLKSSASSLTGNRITDNQVFADSGLDSGGNGGGVYLRSSSNATLTGNIIEGNRASGGAWSGGNGGGVYLYQSAAVLNENIVHGNVASGPPGSGGGGLYLRWSAASLNANRILSNTGGNGGALYLYRSDATLTNNVVAINKGIVSGLYIEGSSPRLLHTTIARNGGPTDTGMYIIADMYNTYSTVALTNTILVGHHVGLDVTANNTVTLQNTLWGSGGWTNATDSRGAGAILTGTVNLWGDPVFVASDSGDYHLGPGSAALDAGVGAGVACDMDGEPRPYQVPDLGADEYWPSGVLKYLYLPMIFRSSP